MRRFLVVAALLLSITSQPVVVDAGRRPQKVYEKQRSKFKQYKRSARKRGKAFSLTFRQFIEYWQRSCSYCGGHVKTIGLDRVDNKRGYELGNILPCCTTCNRMKNDHSLEKWFNHMIRVGEYQRIRKSECFEGRPDEQALIDRLSRADRNGETKPADPKSKKPKGKRGKGGRRKDRKRQRRRERRAEKQDLNLDNLLN